MSKNVKLKSLLEGYAWERNSRDFGKPLPTLEDIQKAHQAKTLAEAAPVKLKLGQMYQVLDLGINEWNDEYEYLGFDTNSREYMFKAFEGAGGDNFQFVGVTKDDLASSVREGLM